MYEPKYKLNKKDDARWHALCVRHCINNVCVSSKGRARRWKFPPLSSEEMAEFEKLTNKRQRKLAAHPLIREEHRQTRNRLRKAERLFRRVRQLLKEN